MILHLQKISKIFLLGIVTALMLPSFAAAQTGLSFTVSPTIFDMTADPGQVWKSSIRVINANPYELKVYMDVVNFKPQGESGVPVFLPKAPDSEITSDFASWITTSPEISLPPETTIELPIQISVPVDAEPGGHFAAVLIGTRPPENGSNETKVETSQVISSLLFLRVSGDVIEDANVRSFRSLDYFLNSPETTFELRVENKGNVHVQPQGEIKIFNMWGQERGVIPVNKQNLFGNVLSDSIRKYNFDWKGEWSIADIGRYTAEATLTYGLNAKKSLAAETSFWIIPWKILLSTIVSLIAFVYLFSWGVKTYIRRMLVIAGVPTHQLASNNSRYPSKKVSVTAPLGAGMLDLRSRLEGANSIASSTSALFSFIKSYWKFFAVAVAVILFVWLIFTYLHSALTPSRYFEVTTDSGMTVTSEDMQDYAEEVKSMNSEPITLGAPVIKVVNRSGLPELTEEITAVISAAGYEVSETSIERGSAERRTVIVFSSSQTDLAFALSVLLDNAPLSAIPNEIEGATPEVTVYIGTDAENANPE